MLGHLGLNVPDLRAAKTYYDAVMPLLGFDEFLTAEDEFGYRPAGGRPGTYLFFYPSAEDAAVLATPDRPSASGVRRADAIAGDTRSVHSSPA